MSVENCKKSYLLYLSRYNTCFMCDEPLFLLNYNILSCALGTTVDENIMCVPCAIKSNVKLFVIRVDMKDLKKLMNKYYRSKKLNQKFYECVEDGVHLESCDKDGYCNNCGYQESPCISCGSFNVVDYDTLLCAQCKHAVDEHGAEKHDAFSVSCDCDEVQK